MLLLLALVSYFEHLFEKKNRYSLFFTILFIAIRVTGGAQQLPAINFSSIKSVDWKSFPYNQLNPIDTILSYKDILVLSEIDHGDGLSKDAETMILKGLIDSGKISKLYLEANWMSCDRINAIFKEKGASGIEEAKRYIQSYDLQYWKQTGFLTYLAEKIKQNKLQLLGFDISGISPAIIGELMQDAEALPEVINYQRTHNKTFQSAQSDLDEKTFGGWQLQSAYYEENYRDLQEFVLPVISAYQQKGNYYRVRQWQSILDMFYWMYRRTTFLKGNKYTNQIETPKQFSQFHWIRDSLMAAKLLSQYTKGEKTVISVSAFHGIRNTISIPGMEKYRDLQVKSMAELLTPQLGDMMYSICFIRASGEYGTSFNDTKFLKVKQPHKNSLEHLLQAQKQDYCFVDLQQPALKSRSFIMQAYLQKNIECNWSKNFSGVFFIKQMKPLMLNPYAF